MFVKAQFTFWEFHDETDVQYIIGELISGSISFLYQPPAGKRLHLLGVPPDYEGDLEACIPNDAVGQRVDY